MVTTITEPFWIDTHAHLDASELRASPERASSVLLRTRANGVALCVIPAVEKGNWDVVRELAHANKDAYALGIHPLYVGTANESDLKSLEQQLQVHIDDGRLVAVGEIGLDFFVPQASGAAAVERQEHFYREQLKLARRFGLPVLLHVRRSADRLLKHLRDISGAQGSWSGIVHAFNGSDVQAAAFIRLGFRLGFGGSVTFERATRIRHLAASLPLTALVMETDSPDIPPHWLYATAGQRMLGAVQACNEPGELPRIASVVAELRGLTPQALARATTSNACAALPRLQALLV